MSFCRVAIPSNRVNVSYFGKGFKRERLNLAVAIPSNRVNVSYKQRRKQWITEHINKSQSPQIGSMFLTSTLDLINNDNLQAIVSQSPQIGSMFLTQIMQIEIWRWLKERKVAIPSNRVNVSYIKNVRVFWNNHNFLVMSQSPQIGSMFLTAPIFFYAL